ncbi:Bacterial regulatory protein, tetR family [Aminobacter sp. MSH1]|uniref:TetR/AcrR family transcriptional regulator n=1 Tax=Aminobacter sp. MSH1 TaxID=374606 RepID=UPI000D367C91|nr:TetR family transcriptional regulator [Aminobacter sp. MSH1]AWC24791.1 Bacterial regulatory protein, tetR family [Aminobacter sp. MSH1]
MPRPKTLSNENVLEAASRLIHDHGPDALTFDSLARACGLSPATLVQRFKTKAGLKQAALLHAWDGLDAKTTALAASTPNTPEGAIELLVGLSHYGGIETYAEGLLLLREDLRDPALRARGAAWKVALCAALEVRFAGVAGAPRGIGLLMASQWQGSLLWWGFDPQGRVEDFVAAGLRSLIAAAVPATGHPLNRAASSDPRVASPAL